MVYTYVKAFLVDTHISLFVPFDIFRDLISNGDFRVSPVTRLCPQRHLRSVKSPLFVNE